MRKDRKEECQPRQSHGNDLDDHECPAKLNHPLVIVSLGDFPGMLPIDPHRHAGICARRVALAVTNTIRTKDPKPDGRQGCGGETEQVCEDGHFTET